MKKILISLALSFTFVFLAAQPSDTTKITKPVVKLTAQQQAYQNSIKYILDNYKLDNQRLMGYFKKVSNSSESITKSNQRLWAALERVEATQAKTLLAVENSEKARLLAENKLKIVQEQETIRKQGEIKKRQEDSQLIIRCILGIFIVVILSALLQLYLHRKSNQRA